MPIDHALPLRVDCDSRLSEDVLPVKPVSVDPEAHNHTSIATTDDGTHLLLAITPGTGLAEVRASGESASGYTLHPLPKGARAQEVVTLVDADGLVNAFYATEPALLHSVRDARGEWGEPVELAACTGLGVAEIPLTGDFAVSGIDARGDLTLCTADGGKWTADRVDLGGELVGGEARLAFTSPDAWVLFATAGGVLRIWPGTGDRVAAHPEVVKVAAPAARLLATYPHADSAMVVFTDTANNLYSSAGFGDTPVRILLGEIVRGTAVLDDDGMVRCYGCAPDGRLWQLRQTAWTADDVPVWAPIFPLDTDAVQVRTPAGGAGALAVTRADGTVDLLSRPRTGGGWTRVPVHGHAEDAPMVVSRYRTRLTVTDANGLPVRHRAIELTSSRLVGLYSGGRTVLARPGTAATLTTDETGAVEFSQPATGFTAVTFTARVEGAAKDLPITPHGYLYETLAGRAPLFNGTATIPPMSADMLRAARGKDGPLLPGLTPGLAKVAADAVMRLAALGPGGAKPDGGFEVDLRDPGAPRLIAYATADAVTERLAAFHTAAGSATLTARGPAPAEALSAGVLGKSLGDWLVDVWQALKSGAVKLVAFIAHPDQETFSALVESAKGVYTTVVGLALEGLAEVGSLMQSVLNTIELAFDKAKDLWQDALHWRSIWRTMDEFYGQITTGLSSFQRRLGDSAVVATGHFFSDLKSELNAGLDQAAAVLGSTTVNDVGRGRVRLGLQPAGGRSPGLAAALEGSPAQHNYVLTKILDNVPDRPAGTMSPLSDGFTGKLIKGVKDSGILADGGKALRDVVPVCLTLFRDPAKAGELRVADLLAALRDLIDLALDACDVLVVTLLELAAEAVRWVHDLLTAPMDDSPVLTWMWENLARPSGNRDAMTLGRLFCLAFAAPVTLACLAATGRGPYDPRTKAQGKGVLAKSVAAGSPDAAGQSYTPIEDAQYYSSMVLIGIDMLTDGVNMADAQSGDDSVGSLLVNGLDLVANIIVQAVFTPSADWNWAAMTRGQKITNATWIGYFAPILTDGVFHLIDQVKAIRSAGDDPGPETGEGGGGTGSTSIAFTVNASIDAVLALALIASGVTGAALQLKDGDRGVSWLDVFEAVMGPLPWAGQPLLLPEAVDGTDGISPIVQIGVLDPLGDFDWDRAGTP
ncbi:hypothetical protein [Sphaerisporangium rhizosphaerae]|uniref:Uncharacterized protein n=1 Tax=Sphaerisporangium rhizosphaerae TaxID=2269375 RepID=A0ABW2PDS4_9ACTN